MSSPARPLPFTYILTASPDFLPAAVEELRRNDPALHQIMELDGELAVVESALSMGEMHELLERYPPVFVRHIVPAQSRVILADDGKDLGALARATLALPALALLEPGTTFSVQARVTSAPRKPRRYSPYAIKSAIVPLVEAETGAVEDVRRPEVVISVLTLPALGFVGLSPVGFNLSDWAGGARRFAREEAQLSRSEFKLLEALELFGVTLPVRGTALDLGAAPGGWTRLIHQAGMRVLAVDPADLDPALTRLESVHIVKGHAQEWVEKLKEGQRKFDVVVCDLHGDARDTARLMVEVAPLMQLSSFAIVTLGLPSVDAVGMDPVAIARQALDELRSRYRTVRARQLFHNRNEVTAFLRL